MQTPEILIVEDEPSIAEVVELYLRRAGYRVQIVRDGNAALEMLDQHLPDLLILDVMLPGVDGFYILRWLRDRSDLPVIFITARREEVDRIAGLELGADDYVVKPFSPQELVSRVRAVMRRLQRETSNNEKPLTYDDLTIDPQTRLVTLAGREITLTSREFDLLWLLALHPRQVFNRQQLLERVWGISEYIDPSTVTVHLRRLREKIELDASHPTRLVTVWGVGYKFEP
ncbi:MAG: DNA-binding response regulator [Chloroflexi bacterium RBG_16_57_11]|nr:MAG: DNA-binding response regulator [Chloroflexi bacterium RBG_16_57_11]